MKTLNEESFCPRCPHCKKILRTIITACYKPTEENKYQYEYVGLALDDNNDDDDKCQLITFCPECKTALIQQSTMSYIGSIDIQT